MHPTMVSMRRCAWTPADVVNENPTLAANQPVLLKIARITTDTGSDVFLSDVGIPITNDNATIVVNVFRKNNQVSLGVSPVEHLYLERYDVRYIRSDGRNQEGVDVPYRISGPLGNVRFHTAGPGGDGEQEAEVSIILVRHQAKAEPPLRNLQGQLLNGGVVGDSGLPIFPGAGVLTVIAEVTSSAVTRVSFEGMVMVRSACHRTRAARESITNPPAG